MGRLIQVKKDGVIVEAYTYDKNGNRASATINNETTNGYYTLDDQIVTYGNNSYQYNDDGYLQTKTTPNGTTTYQYGAFGELQKVVTPTKTIEYLHNANNQRVAKKLNGEIVEKYLWANLTTLLAIYDKDDNLVQRFEYADSRMPLSMTQNNQKYYLHYDQVGSLRAVSDTAGAIIKEVSYDTFGNILTDSNEAFKVPFGFAGGLYDNDSGLVRFGYRDYDPYTSKWTAKDPIGFDGGDSNLYGYVLGDPVKFFDANGLDRQQDVINVAKTLLTNPTVSNQYIERVQSLLDNNKLLYVDRAMRRTKTGLENVFGTAHIATGQVRITSRCWTEHANKPYVINPQIRKTLLHEIKHLILGQRSLRHFGDRPRFDEEFKNVDLFYGD